VCWSSSSKRVAGVEQLEPVPHANGGLTRFALQRRHTVGKKSLEKKGIMMRSSTCAMQWLWQLVPEAASENRMRLSLESGVSC
jgi:hypothetical protein